jgi:hypothetical protein
VGRTENEGALVSLLEYVELSAIEGASLRGVAVDVECNGPGSIGFAKSELGFIGGSLDLELNALNLVVSTVENGS